MSPEQKDPEISKLSEDSPRLKLGELATEMSDWADFDLNGIDWISEIPQWAELYSEDSN